MVGGGGGGSRVPQEPLATPRQVGQASVEMHARDTRICTPLSLPLSQLVCCFGLFDSLIITMQSANPKFQLFPGIRHFEFSVGKISIPLPKTGVS